MNRIRPQITGLFLGFALAAWGGLSDFERPQARLIRWMCLGVGFGIFATHVLQRFDEVIDSKRFARRKKLQILARSMPHLTQAENTQVGRHPENEKPDQVGFEFDKALDTPIHFSPESFADTLQSETTTEVFHQEDIEPGSPDPQDLPVLYEAAIQNNDYLKAVEIYRESLELEKPLVLTNESIAQLRSNSLNQIFQRMHSGTVRDDVASLAQLVVQLFPESTEGRTLGPVLGVLRRSAGLCPRCSKPYKGIANACHECLKGTAEAYQIAWDDQTE
jgi:hypothetical protein